MQKKHIYIVTEGSRDVGLGHISRCLSFYDALVAIGYNVEFLVDGDKTCSRIISDRNHCYINWHYDYVSLEIVRDSIVLLDSLTASQEFIDFLQDLTPYLIVIDDYPRKSYKHALIVDWTTNVESSGMHNHNKNGVNMLLLGAQYSVLRPSFITGEQYDFRKLSTITVIMGGSDVRSLSGPIASMLLNDFPEIVVNIVLGPSAPDINLDNSKLNIYKSLDANELKSLFLESDLVVSAGGQTILELAALNVPTIPIQVVDNQFEDLNGIMCQGFFDKIFVWEDKNLLREISDKVSSLISIDARKKYVGEFSKRGIGRGMDKIINCIESFCEEANIRK